MTQKYSHQSCWIHLFEISESRVFNIECCLALNCGTSSGTLTNVLPHRNAMPQTQDMTPHLVTVYRHGTDLSLCYPLMWNVTLEYTHFNVLGETRPGNPSPTFHTHQGTLNLILLWWLTVGSSVESTILNGSWTRDLWCGIHYAIRSSTATLIHLEKCLSLLFVSRLDRMAILFKFSFWIKGAM